MIDIKRFYDKWGFYPISGAGDLGDGTGSSYPGALDTDTNKEVDDPDAGATLARADVPNDRAAAIVNIETELGIDPAGSAVDLKTRLAVELTDSGALKNLPAGTVMCFFQAAAPTGWTQVTTQNDKVLRVVSGAGGGAAGSRATSATHTHTGPSHTHLQKMGAVNNSGGTGKVIAFDADNSDFQNDTGGGSGNNVRTGVQAAGTGATGADAGLAYIDMLIASKD